MKANDRDKDLSSRSRVSPGPAHAVGHELVGALSFALGVAREILWALTLGFALAALVQ